MPVRVSNLFCVSTLEAHGLQAQCMPVSHEVLGTALHEMWTVIGRLENLTRGLVPFPDN